LVLGSVSDWQSVRVDEDVEPEQVETYIAAAAKAHGIDADKSFPFEVRGNIGPYVMHVNAAAPTGVYVSPDLMGIATHGGERTHAHWVSLDATSTAHLDRWGLKAGAFLLLPKP